MDLTQRAYCDRILRVDLTTGTIETTSLPKDVMHLILGGKGLGAWLLYTEQPAGVDPLSPENRLIFHNGPLTGTTAPTSGRFGVTTKARLPALISMLIAGVIGATCSNMRATMR